MVLAGMWAVPGVREWVQDELGQDVVVQDGEVVELRSRPRQTQEEGEFVLVRQAASAHGPCSPNPFFRVSLCDSFHS